MSGRPNVGGPKLRRLNMGYVFIILAIISFVITFFIFKGIMGSKSANADTKQVKTRELVVVTDHIYAGEVLTEENLRVVPWPEANYPPADVYDDVTMLVGRAVKTELMPLQPVYRLNLAGEYSDGGLPVIIPKGYRAMTILVTENKGVGGFVKPGDRVDVVGTFEMEVSAKVREELEGVLPDEIHASRTVLQDLQVLAIAQEMYEGRGEPAEGDKSSEDKADSPKSSPANPAEITKGKVVSSVTLAVTPEQAEVLAFADDRGTLRLSLRPESERESIELSGAMASDIYPFNEFYSKLTGGMNMPGMGGGFRHNDEPSEVLEDPGEPVEMGGMPSFGGGNSIEIIEGTEKSSVSF